MAVRAEKIARRRRETHPSIRGLFDNDNDNDTQQGVW